jgi:hypothetical protein
MTNDSSPKRLRRSVIRLIKVGTGGQLIKMRIR